MIDGCGLFTTLGAVKCDPEPTIQRAENIAQHMFQPTPSFYYVRFTRRHTIRKSKSQSSSLSLPSLIMPGDIDIVLGSASDNKHIKENTTAAQHEVSNALSARLPRRSLGKCPRSSPNIQMFCRCNCSTPSKYMPLQKLLGRVVRDPVTTTLWRAHLKEGPQRLNTLTCPCPCLCSCRFCFHPRRSNVPARPSPGPGLCPCPLPVLGPCL